MSWLKQTLFVAAISSVLSLTLHHVMIDQASITTRTLKRLSVSQVLPPTAL